MLAKIEQLLQEVENLTASNADELEALRIKYLSKKRYNQCAYGGFPQCTR